MLAAFLGLAIIMAGVGCWIAYQLVRQNGRILVRIESIEARLATLTAPAPPTAAPAPAGLPIGSNAPAFTLEDLAGRPHTLAALRGRAVLLVFFDPACGFCTQMAPRLAALPHDGAGGAPVPILVASGDRAAMRRIVDEHRLRAPVLFQEAHEVAEAYQAHGTPIGYRIDAEGRIASAMAVGADALLGLVTPRGLVAIRDPESNGHVTHDPGPATPVAATGHAPAPSLSRNRIPRDGLAVGVVAPAFRLPRLDGGELALADYRGRRVLLVFSDPQCGPCMQLAPELERAHRDAPEPEIVIISRGDRDANLAKVREHGVTMPVVLQRHWEVSKDYAKFATPIAYLVNGEGVIAADIAIGRQPILALHRAAASGALHEVTETA